MTILNTPNDGLFNVLIVLYRAVSEFGPMPKDRLIKLCSAGPDSNLQPIKATLNRWCQLGFFHEKEGKIGLVANIEKSTSKHNNKGLNDMADLTGSLRRLLFIEDNNSRFWDKEKTRCADFTRGLAYLMAQDIYITDLSTHERVKEVERAQIVDENKRLVGNDVCYPRLRSWARFLGFLWEGEAVIVDPTRAIREDLHLIFANKKTLPAKAFMSQIADVLPVLDGGRYRTMVEDELDPAHWHKPNREELLSTSLSRALWRLDESHHIALESKADTEGRVLQRRGGKDWLRFSHVVLGDGK